MFHERKIHSSKSTKVLISFIAQRQNFDDEHWYLLGQIKSPLSVVGRNSDKEMSGQSFVKITMSLFKIWRLFHMLMEEWDGANWYDRVRSAIALCIDVGQGLATYGLRDVRLLSDFFCN